MTLNWCNRRDGGDSSQPIYGMRASLHGGISSVKEAPVSTGNTRKETGLRSLGLACPGSSATCCRVVHCINIFRTSITAPKPTIPRPIMPTIFLLYVLSGFVPANHAE